MGQSYDLCVCFVISIVALNFGDCKSVDLQHVSNLKYQNHAESLNAVEIILNAAEIILNQTQVYNHSLEQKHEIDQQQLTSINGTNQNNNTQEQFQTTLPGAILTNKTSSTKIITNGIIDVPVMPCPEGQMRDFRGKCRPIFASSSESEVVF